jgi:hypothetical protein
MDLSPPITITMTITTACSRVYCPKTAMLWYYCPAAEPHESPFTMSRYGLESSCKHEIYFLNQVS